VGNGNADVIFVIQDGRIVQRGKHADLLGQSGLYAEFYTLQFSPEESLKAS
jgi:ABC-type transport system involved in Fe-S cluster assembly fused permease/ATPase subunit